MEIRLAELRDLNICMQIPVSIATDHVWQMEKREVDEQVSIAFRTVRLPRRMRVVYPRDTDELFEDWQRKECFLVAAEDDEIMGFLDMTVAGWNLTGWINHLVICRDEQRQGTGKKLLRAAISWAQKYNLRAIMAMMQTKNYPAISFFQKNGFSFCGFNDRYYASHDIAVVFGKNL